MRSRGAERPPNELRPNEPRPDGIPPNEPRPGEPRRNAPRPNMRRPVRPWPNGARRDDKPAPGERPPPNVRRRGVARLSAAPVPMVPVTLCRRNRGTALRGVAALPRPARPSRRPARKFTFGDFAAVGRAGLMLLLREPLKFTFGDFAAVGRAGLVLVPREPLKCSFRSRWPPGRRTAAGRAALAVRAAAIQAPSPRRFPRLSRGVPEAPACRTAPAASPGSAAAPAVQLAEADAAAALSPAAERAAQALSRTTPYSTNGLRITS